MNISVAYALRAVPAVLAILVGTGQLREQIRLLQFRIADQPQYPLWQHLADFIQPMPVIFAAHIACGVLVLIFRWNLLIPLWLIFPGWILLDVFEPWYVLDSIGDLVGGRWGEASTDLIVPSFCLGVGFLPAAIAYKINPPNSLHVSWFQGLGMILVALPIAVMLLQEAALFIGDIGKEHPETFYSIPAGYSLAMAALRVLFVAVLGYAVFAFTRRRTFPLLVAFGLVLGKTYEPFANVSYALLYGWDFATPVPHRAGDYYHYVPHAFAFVACLMGLALIAFVTRKGAALYLTNTAFTCFDTEK